jgi:hypothetical protein
MRCYFMKDGRIENVELLKHGSDDALIQQAHSLFQEHAATKSYEEFEDGSGRRLVYRYHKADPAPPAS